MYIHTHPHTYMPTHTHTQLVEIIKVVGTPTREEIQAMNPNYTEFKFPAIKAHPWSKVRHNLTCHCDETYESLFFGVNRADSTG